MSFFNRYPRGKGKSAVDVEDEFVDVQSGEPTPQSDLGLSALSDDQLLTLGEQARMEIWSRGFQLFQTMWLTTVEHQNAYFKDRTEAWIRAQNDARRDRYDTLVANARSAVQALASKGVIRVLGPEEEKLISEAATLETKLALLEAFKLKLLEGMRRTQQAMSAQGYPQYPQAPASSAGRQAYPNAYGDPRK